MQTENTLSNAIQPQPKRKAFTTTWYVMHYGIRAFAVAMVAVAAFAILSMPTNWDKVRVFKALPQSMLAVVVGRSAAQQRTNEYLAEVKSACAGEKVKDPEACYSLNLKSVTAKFQAVVDSGKATDMDKEKLETLKQAVAKTEQ